MIPYQYVSTKKVALDCITDPDRHSLTGQDVNNIYTKRDSDRNFVDRSNRVFQDTSKLFYLINFSISDIETEIRSLRKWMHEVELLLGPPSFRRVWTLQELEIKSSEHKVSSQCFWTC